MKSAKMFIVFVVLAMVFCAVSFAQATAVNLYGSKAQVDLFAADLQKYGVEVNKIYGEPAMGKYNGKDWPGVRYKIDGDKEGNDAWIPVSKSAVKKGLLCDLQKDQAMRIAEVLKKRTAEPTIAVTPIPKPFLAKPSGEGILCLGDQCWPYDGSRGITVSLRCPIMFEGRELRTFILPVKEARSPNSIGIKMEYHNTSQYHYKTGWQPAVAFYNVTKDPNSLMTPQKVAIVQAHLKKIAHLKDGQPGVEGDACFDLVLNENGSVLYNNTTLRYTGAQK